MSQTSRPVMRLSQAPIEMVRKTRQVPLDPSRAFELFTERMETWWPLLTHSIGEERATGIRFEGHVGGRIVELADHGTEYSWADVITWDPPHRFVVAWHPSVDPIAATILEVRFLPVDGGTQIELEHRGWEELGAEVGPPTRNGYESGWDLVLAPLVARAGSE